jgi:hypothetical protein
VLKNAEICLHCWKLSGRFIVLILGFVYVLRCVKAQVRGSAGLRNLSLILDVTQTLGYATQTHTAFEVGERLFEEVQQSLWHQIVLVEVRW